MGEQQDGSVLVPTNQAVTPIGHLERIEGERAKDLELSPDGKTLAVLAQTRLILYSPDGWRIADVAVKAGTLGLAWTPDSQTLFVSGDNGQVFHVEKTGQNNWHLLTSFVVADLIDEPTSVGNPLVAEPNLEWHPDATITHRLKPVTKPSKFAGNPDVAGLAVSPDGTRLYIALSKRNAITIVDIASETVMATVPVGVAPFRIVVSPDGKTVFVANRGGRHPRNGEAAAISGGTEVRTDRATGATVGGSISFIDAKRFTSTEIDEGRQPAGLCVSRDGKTLYVANSDEDTVTALDVAKHRVLQSISVEPAFDRGFGQLPTDLVLSGDSRVLYVTCGGSNALAEISLPDFVLKGFLPTGWFPLALAERDGRLFVGSSKGFGSRLRNPKGNFHVTGSVSTVQFIDEKDRADLAELTKQVAANNHGNTPELGPRLGIAPAPVPERVGEPSLFHHVVYIIKENHSYDLDLGDVAKGEGDKSLCLFGEEITPNEHALAQQFVLFDNTYCSGTNSADGHQWTDSAVANAYVEQNYGSYARSYPFNGTDPLAHSPTGFLWTSAMHTGKSVRVYGEFVDRPRVFDPASREPLTWSQLWKDYKSGAHKYVIKAETDNSALRLCLDPNYVGFPLTVSDQWRADQFLGELKTFETKNSLPALSILLLPNNHTAGTAPDMPTPRALVADNDLALGRIVDRLSHSRFWPDTLILVIEDDSHFGIDHVDGHRTVAFCISPYTRRNTVVSEAYNNTSFVRTIGLVLGLPAMNRFDRTATPLTACFSSDPDLHPYTYLPNNIPLDEMNPPLKALIGQKRQLARACSKMDWSAADRADQTVVARAAWSRQRPHDPFPWQCFHPAERDDD
jgi:YVTN family beta-propeller protein